MCSETRFASALRTDCSPAPNSRLPLPTAVSRSQQRRPCPAAASTNIRVKSGSFCLPPYLAMALWPIRELVPLSRGQSWVRRFGRPSLLGDSVLERTRSSTFALLGIIAAVGLGLIAVVSLQSWPIVPGGAIPKLPVAPRADHHRPTARVAPTPAPTSNGSEVAGGVGGAPSSSPSPRSSEGGGTSVRAPAGSDLTGGHVVSVAAPTSPSPPASQPAGGGGDQTAGQPSAGGANAPASQPPAPGPSSTSGSGSVAAAPSPVAGEPSPAAGNGNGKAKGKGKSKGASHAETSSSAAGPPEASGTGTLEAENGPESLAGESQGHGSSTGHGNGHAWGNQDK